MKTLSSVMVGLLISAAAGFAAPGGGSGPAVGTATAVSGGGRTASVAPAAHVSSGSVSMSRPTLVNAGGYRTSGGTRSFSGDGLGTISRSSGVMTSQGAAVRVLPTMPTVRNAWSDPVNPRVSGTSSAAYSRNPQANDARPGQTLYPGAYGYNSANRPANGHFGHDHNGMRGYRRYYYNNFPYPVYYPYLYGGIGYGDAVGDYTALTADNNVADLGAPDFTTTPNNYYSYVAPAQASPSPVPSTTAPQSPLPDAPAVGPQNPSPSSAHSPDIVPPGSDSLVEAVQDELGHRGYFAGKSDAVYGDATKEAIRRFQTDQGLPATGRINEATLHALHLD